MTMHPDRRVPVVWTDEEADRIASHIHEASLFTVLHDPAPPLTWQCFATRAAVAWLLAVAGLIAWVFVG